MLSYKLCVNDLPDNFTLKGQIAIDTETMGLSLHRDRLCLMQLADTFNNIYLVQFKDRNFNCPNLKALLLDSSLVKIFHYARFDVAVILKYLKVKITNVYCTKIASKLCRTYASYHSLSELCSDLLNVKISKYNQTSDWGNDKLSASQLKYAVNDVFYLHALKEKLDFLLKRESKYQLALSCFSFLIIRSRLDLLGWIDNDIFAH